MKTKQLAPARNGTGTHVGLIGLDPLFDLLQLVVWSGQVIGERPVSLIIVADVAGGKTSLLERLECPQARFFSDLTSRELHTVLRNDKQVTHILLGDLLNLFGHKTSVVQLTCRTLSAMTGELIRTDPYNGDVIENGGRALGVISAIPPEDLQKFRIRSRLEEGGLYTRFVFARYQYTISTITKIHEWIKSDAYTRAFSTMLQIPDNSKKAVKISPNLADNIHDLSTEIRRATDKLGTRPHHHLRALVKAAAVQRGSNIASVEDLARVVQHVDFFKQEGRFL